MKLLKKVLKHEILVERRLETKKNEDVKIFRFLLLGWGKTKLPGRGEFCSGEFSPKKTPMVGFVDFYVGKLVQKGEGEQLAFTTLCLFSW